jgi:hypothetical protein
MDLSTTFATILRGLAPDARGTRILEWLNAQHDSDEDMADADTASLISNPTQMTTTSKRVTRSQS